MLPFPSEWVQHFGSNLVTAYPPGGGGRFRYHERLRPQPSFSAIVSRMLASDPDFTVHHVGELLRLVTAEGEYGAWVKIDGLREGSRAVRYIGAVFMGDFATALDCVVIVPEKFQEFEALSLNLLHKESFGMTRRPRQFFYVPPVGWQGLPSGLVANFYPPDFPSNLSNIVVQPAVAVDTGEEPTLAAAVSQLGAGLLVEKSLREEVFSSKGVKGTLVRLHGQRAGRPEPLYRELALFVVNQQAYSMRLETAASSRLLELRDVFAAVVGSFQPLPAPDERRLGRAFARVPNVLHHWTS